MKNTIRILPWVYSIFTGCCIFLSFEQFNWTALVFVVPALLALVAATCERPWHACLCGILVSTVASMGALYWIVPSTQEFTHLGGLVSTLFFLSYGLFGNLHFAFYLVLLKRAFDARLINRLPIQYSGFLFALGASALFISLEYLIPHPFDWSLGHSLYRQWWLNQIVELSGISLLTFVIFVTGTVMGIYFLPAKINVHKNPKWIGLAFLLLSVALVFSHHRLSNPAQKEKVIRVALVQANLIELERKATQTGERSDIQNVIDQYTDLTNALLRKETRDLIVWPESVLPFELDEPTELTRQITDSVQRWGIPLIVGASSKSRTKAFKYYNSAYLISPDTRGGVSTTAYFKNKLMLIGEYLPFSDYFPDSLKDLKENYRLDSGSSQEAFILPHGERLGISICVEALLAHYHRYIAQKGIQAILNLSNDSWFGDTSEPFLHLAFATFRAIESRVPFLRAGNSGPSFITDEFGRVLYQSPVRKAEVVRVNIPLPKETGQTLYVRWGDWFSVLCLLILSLSLYVFKERNPKRPG